MTWHLDRSSGGVRADAPGIFVRVEELEGASIGDDVLVTAGPDDPPRRGTIAATDDRAGQRFFRVDFPTPG